MDRMKPIAHIAADFPEKFKIPSAEGGIIDELKVRDLI